MLNSNKLDLNRSMSGYCSCINCHNKAYKLLNIVCVSNSENFCYQYANDLLWNGMAEEVV